MLASFPSNRPFHPQSFAGSRGLLSLLLLLALLGAMIPPYLRSLPALKEQAPSVSGPPPATPVAPTYALPQELIGKPEVLTARTVDSRTFDMGNGTYGLLQDSMPLHYRTDDARWEPINPAFEAQPTGWLNRTNTLQTGISQRSSNATLGASSFVIGWQPAALLVTDAAGASATLGQPLVPTDALPGTRSADGRTVRYPRNWSVAGVQDQWQTKRGSAEYAMLLPALPRPGIAHPHTFDLQVQLHLMTGTTIQVGGKPAQLPLATTEQIEFVGAGGEVLQLQPPRTFEQGRPAVAVAGSYLLAATDDPKVVTLQVRTPWTWLAAPERHYPVVIDPLFQMRSATLVKVATYHPQTNAYQGNFSFSTPTIGRFQFDYKRLLMRFDLPRMPFGSAIDKAFLLATPTDVNHSEINGMETTEFNRSAISTNALLYALSEDGWIADQSAPPVFADPVPPGAQPMRFGRGEFQHAGTRWDITAQASSWLRVSELPPVNHGLMLRSESEACVPELPLLHVQAENCGGFYFAGARTVSAWTADELQETQANSTPAEPHTPATTSGGLRLLVFYNGPTLTENVPIQQFGGDGYPTGTDPYYKADHVFTVPPLPPRWQALVARSFAKPVGELLLPGQSKKTFLQGAVPLSLRADADAFTFLDVQPAEGTIGYLALNGRGSGGNPDRQYSLHAQGTNISPPGEGYDLRLMGETGSIAAANGLTQRSYQFDSRDPLALWNLQLPAGSTNRVDIRVLGDNTRDQEYLSFARNFQPHILRSSTQIDFKSSAGSSAIDKPQIQGSGQSTKFVGGFFPADAAQYALALAYNGPDLTAYTYPPCSDEICDDPPAIFPVKYSLELRVTSCPSGQFPTSAGTCQIVRCPTSQAFPPLTNPSNYREAGGFGLWNQGGWSANTSPATSLTPVGSPAPLIGAPRSNNVRQAPHIAVIGGTIRYDGDSVTVSEDATVMLVECQPPSANEADYGKTFDVFGGAMARTLIGSVFPIPVLAPVDTDLRSSKDPWSSSDRTGSDLQAESFHVYPTQGLARGSADLRRRTPNEAAEAPVELHFLPTWSFTVAGWPSLTSTVGAAGNNPIPSTIASLQPRLGTTFSLDLPAASSSYPQTVREFQALRASAGTITQPAGLGGASRPIQVVILPRAGAIPSDPPIYCAFNCVDLRPLSDSATHLERVWAAPDVHTNTQAGTVMLKRPGELLVWSKDQPRAQPHAGVTQKYSFDAFSGSVTVATEPCEAGGPSVLVVRGETRMALPNIGDPGGDPEANISASYKICQTSLRSVHMSFSSPVGIPLGNSGIFLTGLDGTVEIGADYTVISFGIDFQTDPNGGTVQGHGEITIDTRGLVDIQATATILGVLDGSGELWVAWNPLDIGFKLEVSYKDWLRGSYRAHMWRGQGFANKYHWLPDNNEVHIAAEMSAQIKIKQGAIASWELFELPPFDTEFGVSLAFGQFCTNSACTSYEWGIKGQYTIFGYDVGMYYGFDHGFDFILGTDDHILIDQYGAAGGGPSQQRAVAEAEREIRAAPPAIDGTTLIPVNVKGSAEQLMFMLGWQAGAPQLSLVNPNGVEITGQNALAHGTQISTTGTVTYMTVQQPTVGQWQAKISNLSATGVEHYKFVYFANKGLPGTPQNRGAFTKPTQANEDGGGSYTITWQVPPETPPLSTISLYYTKAEGVDPAPPVGPAGPHNLEQDVPIVKNLLFSAGAYTWDTSTLASGTYAVRAVVDDGFNHFDGQISDPDNTCLPMTTTLPGPRAYDPNRFAGTLAFTATGTIRVNDTIAPPAPSGLQLTPLNGALLAQWTASPARDVTNYLVRWGPRNGNSDTFTVVNQQRLTADTLPKLRVGALDYDKPYGVDVIAIDASGNLSAASTPVFGTANAAAVLPMESSDVVLTSKDSPSAGFGWTEGMANPLAPSSYPAALTQPQLALATDRLRFTAKQGEANPPVQTIDYANIGGGSLNLAATSTSPWITTQVVGNRLNVGVQTSGLTPGFYSGVINLSSAAGSDGLSGSPSCVRVNFWLLRADNDIPQQQPTTTSTTVPTTTPTQGTAVPTTPTSTSVPQPNVHRVYLPLVQR